MILRDFNIERLIYAKLIIYSMHSLQTKNFPLFWSRKWKCDIQVSERSTKVKKKRLTMKFDVFCSFFHSLCSNGPERVINRNGSFYFLHLSNWWPVCWRVRVQSHASNGEDWYECGCRGSTLKRFCSNFGLVILWKRENLLNYLRDCKSSEAYLFFLNNFLTWFDDSPTDCKLR